MTNIRRFIISLIALVFISGFAMAVPVSAHNGDDDFSDSHMSSSSDEPTGEGGEPQDDHLSPRDLTEQFRERAKVELEQHRSLRQQKTHLQRQKACLARKAALTKKMERSVSQATKHKQVFNDIYSKVKDFYIQKQLNVAAYSDLVSQANAASVNAQATIDALSDLNINLDCSSGTVVNDVAAFREAVKSTRDSLKTYRKAIVNLIESIKGASTGARAGGTSDGTQ